MKLISQQRNHPGVLLLSFVLAAAAALPAIAQGVSTTTVQGTVYTAGGAPASGTLQLTWPAFTTAAGQAIAAGRSTVTIGSDGFLSVILAPNLGATPAGLYYTAVYHFSDGTTSTEYWVVPAAAQATLGQVRAQVMPAAQAVQAVSKSYVDQSIQQLTQSLLTAGGGTLSGPLYLSGDPTTPTQAADKHYVDAQFSQAMPAGGGVVNGPITATQLGAVYQADQSAGSDFGAKLQSCLNGLNAGYGGTCDARNFSGSLAMSSNLTIATPNVTVYLPCATIATANSVVIPAGTRNVTLHGCASQGTSTASASQGGTVFLYSGSAALFQVGDSTYAADTQGFHLDNVAINTTSAPASTAQAIVAWRAQEFLLASLYLLGNSNQTGITLDGTGNYTGGTSQDLHLSGFQTAINAIGHQVANPATTDWLNASTFLRLHIDCPTANGNPVSGTTGINLQAGDGNTFTGGDVEGCATALHLGPNAQNNTIVGLRNENSTSQVVADAGSAYNNWMTGGTMLTGKLTDNGTRNSFLDTFHRSFNALNGDWYGSQQDATLTNHYRLGIGTGNERGLLNRYQTDYGYRWTTGLSDATGGAQFYQILDELNNVYRLSIGQYNNGQSSTNNQTAINAAGTGAVVLNGSNNAGTGGVVFGSGGPTSTTVATVSNAGNAQFNGTLLVGGTSQSAGTMTVRNYADAEVDYYLWPGLTTSQKASYTYKDFNGASQWYMVKDASNNWALNSAIGGLDSLKAYQSNNSGDTYIDASNATGAVRINYESGSGAAFNIYGGNSSTLYAGFTGPTSIKFPGLAASAGHNCVQIDNSGYLTNSGASCGTATSVPAAGLTFADNSVQTTSEQGALTGAANDSTARATASSAQTTANTAQTVANAAQSVAAAAQTTANAALPANGCSTSSGGALNCATVAAATTFTGPIGQSSPTSGAFTTVATGTTISSAQPVLDIRHPSFAGGAVCDGATDIGPALQAAWNALPATGGEIQIVGSPTACYWANPTTFNWSGKTGMATFVIQGELQVGTTLTIPSNISVNIVGRSGYAAAQFQAPGETAFLYERPSSGTPITGTLGTAVSTTDGTAATVTFTPSSMNGIYPGTALTIVGTTTCNIGTISRANNVVTATFSSACHIPAGVAITVAGVTDSSYNGSHASGSTVGPFLVTSSDYVTNTLTWGQTAANSSSTGGTVTGLFEDTIENVQVTATTATTATATFYRPHSVSDQFGAVGLNDNNNTHSGLLRDFYIKADGLALWLPTGYLMRVEKVGTMATGACSGNLTNSGVELGYSDYNHFDGTAFNAYCFPWSTRLTQPYNYPVSTSGPLWIDNSFMTGGIKMDHGGFGVFVRNTVCEQCARGIVQVDPANYWNGNYQQIKLENDWFQDNPDKYTPCAVYYLTPTTTLGAMGSAEVDFQAAVPCIANDYYTGTLRAGPSEQPAQFDLNTSRGVYGSYVDGRTIDGEIRGEQASLGPSLVPFATANVPTNPAIWSAGSCTVAPNTLAPDGTTTAGQLTSTAYAIAVAGTQTTSSPAVGDYIFYWVWVRTTTHGALAHSGTSGQALEIDNNSNAGFQFSGIWNNGTTFQAGTQAFDSSIADDWWHPVVGFTQVTSTNGSAGTVRLLLGCDPTKTMQYWMPGMAYVPASSGITLDEANRIRAQLLHGAVPPNYNGPGIPATNEPIATKGYQLVNPLGGAPVPIIPPTLTGYSNDGGSGTGDTLAIAGGRFAQSTNPVCPNGTNGELTTSGCTGTNPLTTKGDLYGYGTGPTRIPVGSNGLCLVADSTQPNGIGWESCTGTFPLQVGAVAPTTFSTGAAPVKFTIYNVPSNGAGQYRLCGYLSVTVAGSGGTSGNFQWLAGYTEDGHAFNNGVTGQLTTNTQWSLQQACYVFYADASTAIYAQIGNGPATGTTMPTVRYSATLERLQ